MKNVPNNRDATGKHKNYECNPLFSIFRFDPDSPTEWSSVVETFDKKIPVKTNLGCIVPIRFTRYIENPAAAPEVVNKPDDPDSFWEEGKVPKHRYCCYKGKQKK